VAITANRKLSVCVENMATAGRIKVSLFVRCSVNKTIMAILVGGHPELSTCEGYFSSGKQPSQVDNSGCPPPKKAIIVYWHYDRGLNNSKLTI
jgi:hypothetical protein